MVNKNDFEMLVALLSNDRLEVLLYKTYENVIVAFAAPGDIAWYARFENRLDPVIFSPGCSIIWIGIQLHTFFNSTLAWASNDAENGPPQLFFTFMALVELLTKVALIVNASPT